MKYSLDVKNEILTVESFSERVDIAKSKRPVLVRLSNLVSRDIFVSYFLDEIFHYSNNGNSSYSDGTIKFKDHLNSNDSKYIFHNTCDTLLFETVDALIPKFKITNKFIKSRIYSGRKDTGSHFHYHPAAVNYLISGRKIWLMFPTTRKNFLYAKDNFEYGTLLGSTKEWYDNNILTLSSKIDGLIEFIQEAGTAVLIPSCYYHFVMNLEDVIGITYSWDTKFNFYD